jgi:hypothetical protein
LGFVFVVVAPTLPAARIAMSEFADLMRYDEETLSDELPDVALEGCGGQILGSRNPAVDAYFAVEKFEPGDLGDQF